MIMAEEVSEQKEGNPGSDPKFQRFSATVERALKGFELSREWQDLISCLSRLNKCLLAYVHFRVLPHKHLICRRLSQCLHPSLPGGVHLKVLDVYKVIFDRIGHDGLAQDLFLYSSGLFPLLEYGSMQVKPILLDIYEQYYLPLGLALLPGLSGLLIALLPGLEEGSECAEKVSALLDLLFSSTKPLAFVQGLWSVLLSSASLRLPALTYMLLQLNKEGTGLCQALKHIESSQCLAVPAICSSLLDPNTLVLRSTLDLVIQLLPLQSLPIPRDLVTKVMIGTLKCLLKRDQSIIRRVFIWLLGKTTKQINSDCTDVNHSQYFLTHVKPLLLVSLKQLLIQSSDSNEKSCLLQPYRLLKIIYEQSDMLSIIPELLPNVVQCLKSQLIQHGGVPSLESPAVKKNGKRHQLRGELLYLANLFWTGLDSSLLWGWVEEYLSIYIKQVETSQELQKRVDLVLFLFNVLPLVDMDGALSLYLPNALLHLSVTLGQSLPRLKLECVQLIASFIIQSLSLLQHYMKKLYSVDIGLSLKSPGPSSPTIERKGVDANASRNPFEESGTLTGLIMALLNQTQAVIKGFVSAHVCDMEGVSSAEMVTLAAKEGLQYIDSSHHVKVCSNSYEDVELRKSLSVICTVLVESMSLLHSFTPTDQSLSPSSSRCNNNDTASLDWLRGLVLVPLRSRETHLFLSSLRILLQLWSMVAEWTKEGLVIEESIHSIVGLMSRKDLLQVFALSLWSLLSPNSYHHEEGASLISLLISLAPPSVPIEGFLLETFGRNVIKPYQQFDVFWKFSVLKGNVPELQLRRLVLRMIEGLQSHNPAIYSCVSTWLITTCQQNFLHLALAPLYALMKEACPSKIKVHKETVKQEDQPHTRYCYASLKETEEKPFSSPYPTYYFTQIIDGPRYSYGLSLFLSVVSISPELITSELSTSHNVIPSPDLPRRQSESESPFEADASRGIRSLLEVILAECIQVLSSDYPQWLDISDTVRQCLCDVKVACTALVTALLASIVKHLIPHKNDSTRTLSIQNSSYVKGLLALCEVQKTTLITLLNLLGPFTEHGVSLPVSPHVSTDASNAISPAHLSLILHLFKCLYYQLIIDSVTPDSSSTSSAPDEPAILQYVPGNTLSSQPMFHLLIQCVLAQSTNSQVQIPFLVLLMSALPYYRTCLELVSSKVLKSLCRNLCSLVKDKCSSCMFQVNSFNAHSQCTCHIQPELLVCYVRTLSSLVHYCLLPEASKQQLSLYYQISNIFWDSPQSLTTSQDLSSNSVPLTPSSQDKRSFGLSWLFGGLFKTGNHEIDQLSTVSSCDSYRGVNTPAGQKVLWLLQHVYAALTKLWKDICTCHSEMRKELSQDISLLVKECLIHLEEGNDILFYSSIAQTWMQWSQGGKAKKPVRDAFIDMFHTFKISSLEDMLASVQATLINLKGDDDIKLSEERQKYLLHFLYRFISSPLQSSEELISTNGPVVAFLKDCHSAVTVGVEVGHFSNTPLLCMLTSILHVFVCRIPVPDLKTNKKQRRELQDIIYRLCDSLSQVALLQLLHSMSTKPTEEDPTLSNSNAPATDQQAKEMEPTDLLLKPTGQGRDSNSSLEVQAMAVLSNVLSHFVDCVYENSEKDRVVSLLKVVLRSVWPSLHNYNSSSLFGCYIHAVKLLASLSGFQVTRKCWKDEVMEWFINNKFFIMEETSVKDWKVIIDNLMSQDKLMFRSLLIRIPSSSTTTAGVVNMFSSLDMERSQRAKLFKRMAFVILSGEKGQYSSFLQEMQEKLLDSVRWYSGPILNAEVLATFRVLLIKLSFQDLLSLWPALISELTTALSELHSDMSLELSTPLKTSQEKLNWYYNACKILDTALSLPAEMLPLFQTVSWGYFGECSTTGQGIGGMIGNILESYKKESTISKTGTINASIPPFHHVKSAIDLIPFLQSLAAKATSTGSCILPPEHLENLMLLDFVEH